MSFEDELRRIIREQLEPLQREIAAIAESANKPRTLGRLYTAEDVATHIGVDVKTVRDWARKGLLRVKWANREMRITPEDLEAFLSTRPSVKDGDETDDDIAARILAGHGG